MGKLCAVAAKLLVAGALLAWLISKIDVGPVIRQLSNAPAVDIVLVFALIALQMMLFGVRWRLISRHFGAALPYGSTMRIVFVSLFFGQTLPSSVGGDAVRILLARREGAPLAAIVSAVIADRLVGMLVLVAMVAATLPRVAAIVQDERASAALALVTMATAGLALLTLILGPHVARGLRYGALRTIAGFIAALFQVLRDRALAVAVVLLSMGVHLLSGLVTLVIARAIDVPVGAVDLLVLVLPVLFVTNLPITIAGWGVREGAMVLVLGYAGASAAQALGVSLAFGIAFALAGIPGAVLWLLSGAMRRHRASPSAS